MILWSGILLAARAMAAFVTVTALLVPICQTALACGSGTPCQTAEIDRFFLPLIAASLMKQQAGATPSPAAESVPAVTTAFRPVIIKPPAKPAAQRQRRVAKLLHQLVAGDLVDGGTVTLLIGPPRPATRPAEAAGGAPGPASAQPPPLRQLAPGSTIWEARYAAELPDIPLWPVDGLALPVDMHLTCGACGPGGALHQFSGAASLELLFDGGVAGWIDDIDLTAEDGMTAKGYLSFSDARAGQLIIEDQLADMFLTIGGQETNFRGTLSAWMTDRKIVNGALAMVPIDRLSGIGAIAGHFSGAPCAPDCGVEN